MGDQARLTRARKSFNRQRADAAFEAHFPSITSLANDAAAEQRKILDEARRALARREAPKTNPWPNGPRPRKMRKR